MSLKPTVMVVFASVVLFSVALASCNNNDCPYGEGLLLTSTAFEDYGTIPAEYTCMNEQTESGVSPPLAWLNAPGGIAGFALTVRDPDSPDGQTLHWGLINIPADASSLAEGISPDGTLPGEAWETLNYRNTVGYAGPCAPAGEPHRYLFTLIALDRQIENPGEDVSLSDVLPEIEAATVVETTLIGLFAQ